MAPGGPGQSRHPHPHTAPPLLSVSPYTSDIAGLHTAPSVSLNTGDTGPTAGHGEGREDAGHDPVLSPIVTIELKTLNI